MSKWDRRTYQATVEHDRYVRNADRDRWLVEHSGIPFPPSMLTTAEVRAETHIRRLHDQTWEQLRNVLILKWVLVALISGFFLASGVPGLMIAGGALVAMGVHHSRERRVWHELHRPVPETPRAPIAADEAARIVAEWEPPTISFRAQGLTPGLRRLEGGGSAPLSNHAQRH